jgi:hypothetical protein
MIPDAEGIVVGYLNGDATVTALGARAGTAAPREFTDARVLVRLLDAADRSFGMEHLINHLFDFHCYASSVRDGASIESSLLARTVRAALVALRDTTRDDVTITDVRIVGSTRRPDTDFDPARERVILSAEIDLHPVTGS